MYRQQLNRQRPGCVILMLDRSGSMEETFFGTNEPKKTVLARLVNDFVVELVLRCVKSPSEPPRDYYQIGLLGYGESVRWELDPNGLLPVSRVAEIGGSLPRSAKGMPMFIQPEARNGTPYCAALDEVGRVVHGWVQANPDSFPPMIINLTDGAPTDGDPGVWCERVRSLGTTDGNALLFNINLSALPGPTQLFPSNVSQLSDGFARDLYHQSSELPEPMAQQIAAMGLPVAPGARGFGFNVDFAAITQFLRVGTSVGMIG